MSVTIQVTKDTATPAIEALTDRLQPQRLAAAVGPAVARLLQRNFRSLGTNKEGYPSTHFWADAARATNWAPSPEGVTISVNKIGVRQRWKGGQISPVNARALTIPISALSYGHTVADFPGAFLLKTKKGAYIVQQGGQVGKSGGMAPRAKAGGNARVRIQASLNFLFKLVASVNQQPDPDVIPPAETITGTAKRAMLTAIRSREPTL